MSGGPGIPLDAKPPRKARKPAARKGMPKARPAVDVHGANPRQFWAGQFGDEYTDRNRVDYMARVPFWQRIVDATMAQSFLDIGCNAGWNLEALRHVGNNQFLMAGIDINARALVEAGGKGFVVDDYAAHELGALYQAGSCEMAITSGVLIHIPPEDLAVTMRAIVDVSSRWVVAIEYDAPSETEVEYRGHAGRLWKRPYGQLYQDMGLSLVETGEAQGFEACSYWLLEK
jgi:pseudaminic acid biosynthesis-associated methylase